MLTFILQLIKKAILCFVLGFFFLNTRYSGEEWSAPTNGSWWV